VRVHYRCSTAAPSHHLPLSLLAQARVAPTQCTTIKGGHPLRLICTSAVSASGKPSPPHSPLFLLLRQCQPASRAFHLRQCQAPTHLGEASRGVTNFPTTRAARHRRRTPVRSATASPSYSDALPLAFSCQASAWDSHNTVGEHLPIIRPLGAHCRSCHGGALCAHHRVSSEPRALPRALHNAERAMHPGRLMGRVSRPPV
jgi:hypothetical protein